MLCIALVVNAQQHKSIAYKHILVNIDTNSVNIDLKNTQGVWQRFHKTVLHAYEHDSVITAPNKQSVKPLMFFMHIFGQKI